MILENKATVSLSTLNDNAVQTIRHTVLLIDRPKSKILLMGSAAHEY